MKPLFTIFFSMLIIPAISQRSADWCGTDNNLQRIFQNNPDAATSWEKEQDEFSNYLNTHFQKRAAGSPRIVPVVIHICHVNGAGNISDEKVLEGIKILNDDFRRLNADTNQTHPLFQPYAVDSEFEFRLARLDPNGNCTNGILRINTPLGNNANDAVKAVSFWPSDKYLNFWLVNSIDNFGNPGVVLGYAQFPSSNPNSWNTYGIVNRSDNWGLVTGSSGTLQPDRTPTHEVGHCFNLRHTFQGSCDPSDPCQTGGDRVCDTPPVITSSQGCPPPNSTCSNDTIGGTPTNPNPFTTDVADQTENYMSYNDCQNMFSAGQKTRMDGAFSSFSQLINLISQGNLVATGADSVSQASPPFCAPIADFTFSTGIICEGQSVSYRDYSYNATRDSTWTWNWTFPGGTPSSSNLQNPTVSYSTPGTYSATLTVTNNFGSSPAETKTSIIEVREGAGSFVAPYVESFSTAEFPMNNSDPSLAWTNETFPGWSRNSQGSFTIPASMYYDNFAIPGTTDQIINSPVTDLSGLSPEAYLHFKVSYRSQNNAIEFLKVYTSVDCGNHWLNIKNYVTPNLKTGPDVNGVAYYPASVSDWRAEVINISSLAGNPNVMFRFEFEANGGNNIFIDDFEISGSDQTVVGIRDLDHSLTYKTGYPNPTSGEFIIPIEVGLDPSTIQLSLVGSNGREYSIDSEDLKINEASIEINLKNSGLPEGIYTLVIQDERQVYTSRFVLTQK